MAGDNLAEIIDLARREMPDVDHQVWGRLEGLIRRQFGTQRLYIAAHAKRQHLQALEQAGVEDADRLAKILGLSVRRVRQLKRLCGEG